MNIATLSLLLHTFLFHLLLLFPGVFAFTQIFYFIFLYEWFRALRHAPLQTQKILFYLTPFILFAPVEKSVWILLFLGLEALFLYQIHQNQGGDLCISRLYKMSILLVYLGLLLGSF